MIYCKTNSLRNVQHFHTPTHIMHDSGIGIDISVKSHLLPQHFLKKRPVICKSKRLKLQFFPITIFLNCTFIGRRFGIIWHDRRRMILYCNPKCRNMIFLQRIFCSINIPLSSCIVRIKSILPCSASRKMLGRHSNTVFCHSLSTPLDPWNQMIHKLTNQLRIFSKCSITSLPSRISHHICHIHIAFSQTTGIPLPAYTICKCIHNFNACSFDRCCNSHCPRPCCKCSHCIIHSKYHFTIFISGIRCNTDRNQMFTFLCDCMQLIHPVCHIFRSRICTQNHVT